MKETYKIVEEYTVYVPGLNFSVKGRISIMIGQEAAPRYFWTPSHWYGAQNAAGTHRPSHSSGENIEEARDLLLGYLNGITPDARIEKNELY